MQNHVPINTNTAHPNHIPDETIGIENMPAPTAVPVTIVIPGNKEINSRVFALYNDIHLRFLLVRGFHPSIAVLCSSDKFRNVKKIFFLEDRFAALLFLFHHFPISFRAI